MTRLPDVLPLGFRRRVPGAKFSRTASDESHRPCPRRNFVGFPAHFGNDMLLDEATLGPVWFLRRCGSLLIGPRPYSPYSVQVATVPRCAAHDDSDGSTVHRVSSERPPERYARAVHHIDRGLASFFVDLWMRMVCFAKPTCLYTPGRGALARSMYLKIRPASRLIVEFIRACQISDS